MLDRHCSRWGKLKLDSEAVSALKGLTDWLRVTVVLTESFNTVFGVLYE